MAWTVAHKCTESGVMISLAPKERDLMFIGRGVGNAWNQRYEEALFFEGYGKTYINRDLLAYYLHERILEDVVDFV